ncbi:hypothetical protein Sgleb_27500 [Streptomyces glebosus]|uniref:Uncharacterized protein n=1 Tax=Streptomyces glebosus TaxID=249580 RepID=A0A640STE2_9ACTN|nr:hypothetical protein [Streptomyces glebosus]GFE14703.1 hypothetical protein Sgleb_27500 [Streptomyces glebosus]GHG69702.1 hypothetical protein GCM10010513_40880 [Streptomyces glebosus]
MAEQLSPEDTATLRALLAGSDPVSRALLAQIPHTRVVGRCGCGCVTVDLEVDRTAAAPAPSHDNPAVDAWYDAPYSAGVMVCTEGGYLSVLEIYSVADEPITAWPDVRCIER